MQNNGRQQVPRDQEDPGENDPEEQQRDKRLEAEVAHGKEHGADDDSGAYRHEPCQR